MYGAESRKYENKKGRTIVSQQFPSIFGQANLWCLYIIVLAQVLLDGKVVKFVAPPSKRYVMVG